MRSPQTRAPAGRVPHRLWLLLAPIVAALALVAAVLFLASRAQAAPPRGPAPGSARDVLAQEAAAGYLTWTLREPLSWVRSPVTCRVIVTDTDGLLPATAACEISTDGGATWRTGPTPAATYGPDLWSSVYITATNISFPSSSGTQNRVRFQINDGLGSRVQVPSDAGGFVIQVDNDPPWAPGSFVCNRVWSNVNGAFAISWTNPTDLSGIAKAYYKLDGYPTSSSDYTGQVTRAGVNSLSGLNMPAPGKHYISVWLQDAVGNVSFNNYGVALDAFWYDPIPPTSSAQATGTPGNAGWFRSPVQVTLTGSDPTPGSGVISRFDYRFDPSGGWTSQSLAGPPYTYQLTVTGEGAHTLQYRATDGANNTEANPNSLTINIDTVAPATGSTLAGTPGANGWYISPVSVHLTPGPDTSGVASTNYRVDAGSWQVGTDVTVSSEGSHQVDFHSVDVAGNVEADKSTGPFRIDTRAPTVAADPQPVSSSGWYTGPVTVNLTASDPGENDPGGSTASGIAALSYRIDSGAWYTVAARSAAVLVDPAIYHDGIHTLYYRARDVAGNLTQPAATFALKFDTGAPVVTGWTFTGAPGAAGWYVSQGTVTLQASDPPTVSGAATSGVAQVYFRLDEAASDQLGPSFPVTTEGVHIIRAYARDGAGNIGPTRVFTGSEALRIDGTPPPAPTINRSAPFNAFGWYSQTVGITVTASDAVDPVTGFAGSGVQKVEYRRLDQGVQPWQTVSGPLSFSSEGQGSYEARALDLAGNLSATQPFTVYIDHTAPAAPVPPVRVTPNSWTNVNNFSATWSNPSDLSGIAGVYYTVDNVPAPGVVPDGYIPLQGGVPQATGIHLPAGIAEGKHFLFLWLLDKAGNADPYHRQTAQDQLQYDATPPTNASATPVGTLGCNGYYTAPVNVTLRANDSASGVGAFAWITSTTWVTTPTSGPQDTATVNLPGDGKYTLCYKAIDRAGNPQATYQCTTLSVDRTPPSSPGDLQATPVGWSSVPTLTLTWLSPHDFSGLAGGYYTLDRRPTTCADGVPVPIAYDTASRRYRASLTVPREGRYTLYFWLKDKACNCDAGTAVTQTLRYDATPPVTTLTPARPPDRDIWYTRPVSVSFTMTDGTGSGVIRTQYRVNDGPWQTYTRGSGVLFDQTGLYTLCYRSTDEAGNTELERCFELRVDMTPPATYVSVPANSATPDFQVAWGASDAPDNRVSTYWVQYRDGTGGSWQNWQNATAQTSATFTGVRGHTYYFRARARDDAGNEGAWPAGPQASTFVGPVANGDFASGLNGWQVLKDDPAWQASVVGGQCGAAKAALLGSPDYDNNGGVPMGTVSLQQSITLPPTEPGQRLELSFRYRVITWDVMFSTGVEHVPYDSFDVDILDEGGSVLRRLVSDGNPGTQYGTRFDTGCQSRSFDLAAYAGRTVQLRFSNSSREDHYNNTYTYLEDVRIVVTRRAYLPLAMRSGTGGGSQALPLQVTAQNYDARPPRLPEPPDPRQR